MILQYNIIKILLHDKGKHQNNFTKYHEVMTITYEPHAAGTKVGEQSS
jgi:hypothetical protein